MRLNDVDFLGCAPKCNFAVAISRLLYQHPYPYMVKQLQSVDETEEIVFLAFL